LLNNITEVFFKTILRKNIPGENTIKKGIYSKKVTKPIKSKEIKVRHMQPKVMIKTGPISPKTTSLFIQFITDINY